MRTEIYKRPGVLTDRDDPISMPLYAAGLVVSVIGIIAVNSALSDDQFGSTTLVLTIAGFAFSIVCRWLRIKIKVLEILAGSLLVYFGYRYVTHSFSLSVFIPPDVTAGDLIMAIVLAWLTAIRSWALSNDESVVFTSVTSIAMIGLVGSSDFNDELLIYFFIFMVFATFLLLHQTYLVQRAWSEETADDGAESGIIKTQIVYSLLSGVVALLIGVVVVVPLRAIGSHLSLSTAMKSFVGNQRVSDQVQQSLDPTVVLSDDEAFTIGNGDGDTGSNPLIMRAIPADGNEHYYRGRTYDAYEGNEWITSVEQYRSPLPSFPSPANTGSTMVFELLPPGSVGRDPSEPVFDSDRPDTRLMSTRFRIAGSLTNTLYVPYGTQSVTLPATVNSVVESEDNHLGIPQTANTDFDYETLSVDNDVSPSTLQHAPTLVSSIQAPFRQQYIDQRGLTEVSTQDQQQLRQVAQSIVNSVPKAHRDEFDEAEAIRSWVSRRCIYSLSVDPVPANEDAVSYFLFKTRRGYCDLFASSMAILCRYAGIPARVATGFAPGERDQRGGYDLHERDKHAWVEVWFPTYGWQVYDPTVGSVEDSSINDPDSLVAWLNGEWLKARIFFLYGGLYSLGIKALLGLAVLYFAKFEVYDKLIAHRLLRPRAVRFRTFQEAKQDSPSSAYEFSRHSARSRYAKFQYIMAGVGQQRLPHQTPEEFMTAIKLSVAGIDNSSANTAFFAAAETLTSDVMMASFAPIDLVGELLALNEESGTGESALHYVKVHAKEIMSFANQQKTPSTV